MTIYLASDHAGYSFKNTVLDALKKEFGGSELKDLGPSSDTSVDYPDFATLVATEVVRSGGKGILICGSGLGMCISANKVSGIRAVSAWDVTSSRLSRQHNDANVVCIGARLTGLEVALDIIRTFLKTEFEGGRHAKRVEKIKQLEKSGK